MSLASVVPISELIPELFEQCPFLVPLNLF